MKQVKLGMMLDCQRSKVHLLINKCAFIDQENIEVIPEGKKKYFFLVAVILLFDIRKPEFSYL